MGSGEGETHYPVDLLAVGFVVVATVTVVTVPVLAQTPLRILFGLPFVLFVPGYAIVSALFPEAGGTDAGGGLSGLERLSLSIGASVAIMPFIGLGLNTSPVGITLMSVVASMSVVTGIATGVAGLRRQRVPAPNRLRIPYRRWLGRSRQQLTRTESAFDVVLSLVLVVSLLLAAGTAGYAVLTPSQEAPFTEFYLLTEGEDGTLVADNYPQEFTMGESKGLVVGVENHEHETVSYTVIVRLQKVAVSNDTTTITEQETLRTFETRLAPEETQQWSHEVSPTIEGDRVRLTYLLFRDSVPAQPTVENAYRETHLWVSVAPPDSQRPAQNTSTQASAGKRDEAHTLAQPWS